MKKKITRFSLVLLGLIAFSVLNAQTVNMDRYITLTVLQGQNIELDFGADVNNTDIRIVSGTTDATITIGMNYAGSNFFTTGATTMTIYGNIKLFNCRNGNNPTAITGLDVSHNNGLYELECSANSISSLDISNLMQLRYLCCDMNPLTSLDVSNNSLLTTLSCVACTLTSLDVNNLLHLQYLWCNNNSLTSLNVSNLSQLIELNCSENNLTSLNASNLSQLIELDCGYNPISSLNVNNDLQLESLNCGYNSLSSLKVSNLTQLKYFRCQSNNFSKSALDSIFCQLPQKGAGNYSWIMPIESDTSSNYAIVMATTKQNAIDKNWKVVYSSNGSNIPATTGANVCNVGIEDVNNDIISAKVYPNPLTKDLTIEANENIERLEVLNVLGEKVLTKEVNKNNLTLDFSTMNKGVYIIKLYSSKGERSYKVVKE